MPLIQFPEQHRQERAAKAAQQDTRDVGFLGIAARCDVETARDTRLELEGMARRARLAREYVDANNLRRPELACEPVNDGEEL